MSKATQQRSHFKRRVFERYSLTINDGEYDFLVSRIRKNDKTVVKFLTKQSNRVSVHLLMYKDHEIVVVYDKERKSLVTALPEVCKDPEQIYYFLEEFGDE